MKLNRLLIFLFFLFFTLEAVLGQEIANRKISGNFQETPLHNILQMWEKQLAIKFCYLDELIKDKTITVKFEDQTLEDVLIAILPAHQIGYKIYDASHSIVFFNTKLKESAFTGELHGQVVDKRMKTPLTGVNVVINGTTCGTVSDADGYFTLRLPVNIYTVSFQMIGYEKKVVPDVLIRSQKITTLLVKLNGQVLEFKDKIVATASGYFVKKEIAPVSTQNLTYEEIRRAPGTREDICRMVQNLPGAAPAANANRNDLIIRGGSPTEVLYRIDNIDIPNPNHFATQGSACGAVSLLNTEFVKEIDFLSGAFPAQYGDKLSAVLDVKYREGNPYKVGGKADISDIGAGGNIEGPINGGKGSWMFAFHHSHLSMLSPLLNAQGLAYTNYQGKLVYNFTNNWKLSMLGIGGNDFFRINDGPSGNRKNDCPSGWSSAWNLYNNGMSKNNQFTLGANLSKVWSPKLFSSFTVSHSFSRFFIDSNLSIYKIVRSGSSDNLDRTLLDASDIFDNTSLEQVSDLKTDWIYLASQQDEFRFGVGLKGIQFHHKIMYRTTSLLTDEDLHWKLKSSNVHQNITPKVGLYLNYLKKFGPGFSLNSGVRYDYFDLPGTHDFSPRLNASYRITDRLTLNAGTGIYFQTPQWVYISSSIENLDQLKSIRCMHFIAGLDLLVTDGTLFSVEAFRKNYSDYPVATNPALNYFTTANSGADYDFTWWGNVFASEGSGFSHGIEFLLRKKLISGIFGNTSYSYSVIKHKAGDGILRPGKFDNQHVFNLMLGCRANKSVEFSLKWRIAGGRPYTPFDIETSERRNCVVKDMSRLNTERLDVYHRLDFRIDHRTYHKNFTVVKYLSVENVYFRKNPDGVCYPDKFNWQNEFLPIGGFNIEF